MASNLGVALSAKALDEQATHASAVESLLQLEPGNLWANLLKGKLLADAGDATSALSFFMNALRIAESQRELPPALVNLVREAKTYCDAFTARLQSSVTAGLQQSGIAGTEGLGQFQQSLDILFGRKQIYLQSPKYYYYPGLPNVQFFPENQFPWIGGLESQTANIRAEALALLQDDSSFRPYLESDPNRPRKSQDGMTDNPNWGACYLINKGKVVSDIASRCPATMEALRQIPLATLPNRSPSVLFSLLRAGAHIPPHSGLVNTRLICHLPVVVPPRCYFRVGNETRQWEAGKVWVFDDSIEHEAWNQSAEPRIVLLFEIWRPELSETERSAITELFRAMDQISGTNQKWDI